MARSLAAVTAELYARAGEADIEPSLDRIGAALQILGDPHRCAPVIHLTGTNGKTSTARMAEALLRRMGLRTGLFTSPHLVSVTERIQLDGQPIADERFVELYEETKPLLELVDDEHGTLSFFEAITAMAYAAFADAPVDVMIIEVGLGGTWDATNLADGAVAVVTEIAIDHTEYLGPTIESIATEKAGIIKEGSIAVLGRQRPAAEQILLARCAQVGARAVRAEVDFGVVSRSLGVGGQLMSLQGLRARYDDLFLPLFGEHQATNAALALAAVEALAPAGGPLSDDLVREAFADVTSPGRLEVLRRSPSVIIDAAHNPAGAAVLAQALEDSFAFAATVAVVAVMADKDVAGIIEALEPAVDHIICTSNGSPRGMPAKELGDIASLLVNSVSVVPDLVAAMDAAYEWVDERSGSGSVGIIVTGSVVTAGAVRALLRGDK